MKEETWVKLIYNITFISCSILVVCALLIFVGLNKIGNRIHEHTEKTIALYDDCIAASKNDVDKIFIYNGSDYDCSK